MFSSGFWLVLQELGDDSGSASAPPLVQSWGVWLVLFCLELGISWGLVCLDISFFLGSLVSRVVFYLILV